MWCAVAGAEQCDGDATSGARRPGCGQPQVTQHSAARPSRPVSLVRLHRSRLLPRSQPARGQELALLRQVQDGAAQHQGNSSASNVQCISVAMSTPTTNQATEYVARIARVLSHRRNQEVSLQSQYGHYIHKR